MDTTKFSTGTYWYCLISEKRGGRRGRAFIRFVRGQGNP